MRSLLAVVLAIGPVEEPVVWIFFSPDAPDASGLFEQAKGLRTRPVFVTERYFGAREPSAGFLSTLRVSGEVAVVDEEGLREAKRLRLRELPAVAVTRGRTTHVAYGSRVSIEELLRCAR